MALNAAADRLGVSVRQMQRLATNGKVRRVGPNRVDAESVLHLERSRADHRRRAWTEQTAWAAIALLSGVEVDWLGQAQKSRLRARLRGVTAGEFVGSCRNRARIHRLTGHRAVAQRIAERIVGSGATQGLGDLTEASDGTVDGYVTSGTVDGLVAEFALSTSGTGQTRVVLRATALDLDIVAAIAKADQMLAAVDLATSLDTREASAAASLITARLSEFS